MMRVLTLTVIFLMTEAASGQQKYLIKGKITDSEGNPVAETHIQLSPSGPSTFSDTKGFYQIETEKSGITTLIFSKAQYEMEIKQIEISNSAMVFNINLREKPKELKEVIVRENNEIKKINNLPLSVAVIETKKMRIKTANTADVINTISGVNVRQNGGLGSDVSFSINGLAGKQVRFFMDGIPLENYSSEMNIASVPAAFFSRFEVYKGMVPIHLASDVLGGAINVISRSETKDFADLSYSIGSFNTHKLAAAAQYSWGNIYLLFNAFANHSDNDYSIDAEVLNKDGSSYAGTVKRFHSKFSNYMLRPELGVKNVSWADQAFISFYTSGNRSDIQHDALAVQPYGEALMKTGSLGALVRYKKKRNCKKSGYGLLYIR
ncbi:TonB-dependent receptor plug domain-containing protein [Chryseobacterium sp.]|uniref:TonB-dependent receptor plug domain-containing protein n=1 Tax=Chryseobacterium sp. TaxID=1871047 RepID=UPI0025C33B20|nr:TonB-dependent receptor plug domain-containing protein [Chryseobacterium sp.]MBV8326814.1 TonB-dependent receptor plug domain-containing protein [Chryseobacterium sp.]